MTILESIRQIASHSDAGKPVARANYSAYGILIASTGTLNTPFLWQGAFGVQTDPNGLHHMRARYYHAYLGRWLSEDPLGLSAGPNVYAYCNGNPIMANDPSGLFGTGFVLGAGGTAGAYWGVGGTASVGGGLFVDLDKSQGILGGYTSAAAAAGPTHLGLGGGAGLGGFITNANSPKDLEKTSHTVVGNIGLGIGAGFTFSWGNGIFNLEFYTPRAGPTGGAGISYIPPPGSMGGNASFNKTATGQLTPSARPTEGAGISYVLPQGSMGRNVSFTNTVTGHSRK